MNNATFGKIIDNLRKRISVKLINNAKDYVRFIRKSSFVSQKIFSKNCVGLKSKMYSLIDANGEEVTKAKGVNKNVGKKIRHKELVDVLFNKKVIRHNMKRIQSKLHRIGTYDVCKTSLFCFDDKRYILDDSVNSLAYFHKDIQSS